MFELTEKSVRKAIDCLKSLNIGPVFSIKQCNQEEVLKRIGDDNSSQFIMIYPYSPSGQKGLLQVLNIEQYDDAKSLLVCTTNVKGYERQIIHIQGEETDYKYYEICVAETEVGDVNQIIAYLKGEMQEHFGVKLEDKVSEADFFFIDFILLLLLKVQVIKLNLLQPPKEVKNIHERFVEKIRTLLCNSGYKLEQDTYGPAVLTVVDKKGLNLNKYLSKQGRDTIEEIR